MLFEVNKQKTTRNKLKGGKNISLCVNRHDVAMVLQINMNLKLALSLSTALKTNGKLATVKRFECLNLFTVANLRLVIK